MKINFDKDHDVVLTKKQLRWLIKDSWEDGYASGTFKDEAEKSYEDWVETLSHSWQKLLS
jgi:hypothetical protein